MSGTDDIALTSRLTRAPAWRWVQVGVAALAMVATLPGRTHGLGLFTEPILRSLHLDRESYGFLNLWATLLGGLFCLPCGWLIDRLGTRAVLTTVTVALGAVIFVMSGVQGDDAVPLTVWVSSWMSGSGSVSLVFLPGLFVLLPGPAAAVRRVPLEGEPLRALEGAGFTALHLAKFGAAPCFPSDGVQMREQLLEASRPAAVPTAR